MLQKYLHIYAHCRDTFITKFLFPALAKLFKSVKDVRKRQYHNHVFKTLSFRHCPVMLDGWIIEFWRRMLHVSVHVFHGVARDSHAGVQSVVDDWCYLDVISRLTGKTLFLRRRDPVKRRLRQRQQTLKVVQLIGRSNDKRTESCQR